MPVPHTAYRASHSLPYVPSTLHRLCPYRTSHSARIGQQRIPELDMAKRSTVPDRAQRVRRRVGR
eukprot:2615986-Rhodomonas_salina.1